HHRDPHSFPTRRSSDLLPALVGEIRLMAENGLAPMQALMAATRNAAAVCRADDRLGSIEVGKLADLIVVDGDPLEDLNRLGHVRSEEHTSELQSPYDLV